MKHDFRSKSFKKKIQYNSLNVYNLMIGCSIKKRENNSKKAFEQMKKETWIKILS